MNERGRREGRDYQQLQLQQGPLREPGQSLRGKGRGRTAKRVTVCGAHSLDCGTERGPTVNRIVRQEGKRDLCKCGGGLASERGRKRGRARVNFMSGRRGKRARRWEDDIT